jgi:creatinine amidohydrolase/Fe(II)-dependent formamide hydrolase-like protein
MGPGLIDRLAMVHTGRLHAGSGLGDRNGVVGDPSRANAELGQLGVEMIVRGTVAIREAIAHR